MSSCVSAPAEQNELVVKTGFEVRLRKVDFSKINGKIIVITNLNSVDEFGCYLKKCSLPNSSWFSIYTSILDVEKPNRGASAAILCYDEPSYNGMQCLYHMFGQRLGLTSFDMFKQVVQQCQKNGEGIVFTRDELMWCPSPKAMASEAAVKAPEPVVVPPASSPAPAPEPTIQGQLIALTAAITALTKLVETAVVKQA
jgi:hypothetical protein